MRRRAAIHRSARENPAIANRRGFPSRSLDRHENVAPRARLFSDAFKHGEAQDLALREKGRVRHGEAQDLALREKGRVRHGGESPSPYGLRGRFASPPSPYGKRDNPENPDSDFPFLILQILLSLTSMKTFTMIFLCCVALLLTGCGISTTKPSVRTDFHVRPHANLRAEIDGVLQDALFTSAHIAIKVVTVKTGEVLYAKNVRKLHHPASTMKLITAAAALAKLGAAYRFETTLYADAIADGRVAGNVYLKGKADPVLQEGELAEMVNALRDAGVQSVSGGIVVDETYLDAVREGPGWMWDDKPLGLSTLAIRGSAVKDRALACGTMLKEMLQQEGIVVNGEVSHGTVPSGAITIVAHLSPPLAEILKLMNKPSDNTIAELIFKTLGAEVKSEPGTWQKGSQVVGEFLEEIVLLSRDRGFILNRDREVSPTEEHQDRGVLLSQDREVSPTEEHQDRGARLQFRIVDGSGLSRYNLITAELLTDLLVAVYNDFELMPEYVASLPIAGVDGTLENRMKGMRAEKVLRAKTGTLSGVSTLAGYTVTADGEVLAFCILISHYVGPAAPARRVQDEIGNCLTRWSRD